MSRCSKNAVRPKRSGRTFIGYSYHRADSRLWGAFSNTYLIAHSLTRTGMEGFPSHATQEEVPLSRLGQEMRASCSGGHLVRLSGLPVCMAIPKWVCGLTFLQLQGRGSSESRARGVSGVLPQLQSWSRQSVGFSAKQLVGT